MSTAERTAPVEYRPIEGFPAYRVGDDGSIWTRWKKGFGFFYLIPEWTRMNPCASKPDGYFRLTLRDHNRLRSACLHRLVIEAFVGPCPRGMECCHCNGIPGDNRLANLRWDTRRANIDDALRHGTMLSGEAHEKAKLTAEAVRVIRREYVPGRPYHSNSRALADRYGVTPRTIRKIAQGTRWRHVV